MERRPPAGYYPSQRHRPVSVTGGTYDRATERVRIVPFDGRAKVVLSLRSRTMRSGANEGVAPLLVRRDREGAVLFYSYGAATVRKRCLSGVYVPALLSGR